ncbi:MAG TPA: arginine deiminase family protein [Gaiella sp.]|nr:arginine deiminase family protein [Gaiella sp.]
MPDPEAFAREHDALTAALRSVGTEIVYLRDVVGSRARRHLEENPNHVYTRDSAITLPWLPNVFIRGAMRKAIRRREPDVMACRELVPEALDQLVAIELVPERMNLDGALVPVAHDVVLVDPSSIVRSFLLDERGRRGVDVIELLRLKGFQPLVVTRREATALQACNCVCLGEGRVVAYDLCRRALGELRDRDVDVLPVPGSELIKGTGGPRCMTRPLYR